MLLHNFNYLLPEIYLTVIITFLLAYGVYFTKVGGKYNKFLKFNLLTVLSLVWTSIIIIFTYGTTTELIGPNNILEINSFNYFIKQVMIISTIYVLFICWDKYFKYKISNYEYSLLILLSLLGLLLIVSAKDLLVVYLAVELISLSLYVLAGIQRTSVRSSEAGLKYFVLGGLSSGLLLFGTAVLYISTGTTNMVEMGLIGADTMWFKLGSIILVLALLFKLAAAPLHMWAPDVYEGAPTVVTSYFAIVPKIGLLYVLYIILNTSLIPVTSTILNTVIFTSALLSIITGTLGAIVQNRIVRLMAYSAIAHMGFILLGISTGTLDGLISSIVYIVIYIIMSIATFSVILTAFNGTKHKYLTDIRGLGKTQPVLAIALALTLLSIAGIPPLAGFLSKFYVILNLIEAKNMIGAITAIVITVAASYYYLKIIKTMYFTEGSIIENPPRLTISPLVGVIMGQALYFIITLMVYPKPVLMLPMVYIMNSLI